MDKEMTEREAFEHLWINGIQTMQYRSEKERAEMWWQAACKWQRERDAEICLNERVDADATESDEDDLASANERIRELEAVYEKTHNWLCDRNEQLAAERAVSDKLLEALKAMEEEKSDYMIRNNLGSPSGETTNRMARAAIAEVEAMRKEQKEKLSETL